MALSTDSTRCHYTYMHMTSFEDNMSAFYSSKIYWENRGYGIVQFNEEKNSVALSVGGSKCEL